MFRLKVKYFGIVYSLLILNSILKVNEAKCDNCSCQEGECGDDCPCKEGTKCSDDCSCQKNVECYDNCSLPDYTHSLIFFHGIGDNNQQWGRMFNEFTIPNTRIIIPTAKEIPISFYSGQYENAWFDFKGLKYLKENDKEEITRAVDYAHNLIDSEIRMGIPSENIILAGFSQGGALALYAGLQYRKQLAGLIAISAWMPLIDEFSESIVTENRNIPILLCHNDSFVPLCHSADAVKVLNLVSENVMYKTFICNHEHKKLDTISQLKASTAEIEEVSDFLKTSFFIQFIQENQIN